MKDESFDSIIRNKIDKAKIVLPKELNDNIKTYMDNLPSKNNKAIRLKKCMGLTAAAAILIFSLCTIYQIYSNNSHIRNAWDVNKNYAVTAAEKKQLGQKGYIINREKNCKKVIEAPYAEVDRIKSPYTNIEALATDSDIIVEGQVIGIRYFDYHPDTYYYHTFTESMVKIFKSYNGKVKAGDIVTFIEAGGITTQYDEIIYSGSLEKDLPGMKKITKKDLEKAKNIKVLSLVDHVPVMQPDDHVLIFAKESPWKSDDFPVTGKAYYPIGNYEGKFTIQNNIVQRYEAYEYKQNDIFGYTLLKMNEKQMSQKIESALRGLWH